jgi:hypothetical protein
MNPAEELLPRIFANSVTYTQKEENKCLARSNEVFAIQILGLKAHAYTQNTNKMEHTFRHKNGMKRPSFSSSERKLSSISVCCFNWQMPLLVSIQIHQ